MQRRKKELFVGVESKWFKLRNERIFITLIVNHLIHFAVLRVHQLRSLDGNLRVLE